jgi:hypothetical protein
MTKQFDLDLLRDFLKVDGSFQFYGIIEEEEKKELEANGFNVEQKNKRLSIITKKG